MPDGKTMKDEAAEAVLARIDHYELLRELGGGGFGTVYLARDTVSGVAYAVKGLPPFVKNNREELESIKANFTLVSRLSHTNIARAHVLHLAQEVAYSSPDVRKKLRVDPGDILMVMEFAPGVTLTQWRRQFPDGKVPVEQALEIVRQIASALDYAHGQKVLHRDVKPANVMVETSPDGKPVVRVVDFGLAAEIRTSMGRVSREIHNTSGTRPYMAPEQWLGERQGPATDQYALAVLFHELVTGDVPFASVFGTGDPVVMMNVVGRKPFASPAGLPRSVRKALVKALAKKPEDRFGSCAEFVDALEKRGAVFFSRWNLWALCGMCAVALIGFGTWLHISQNGKSPAGTTDVPPVADAQERVPPAGTTGVPPVVVAQERVPPVGTTGVPPVVVAQERVPPTGTTGVPPVASAQEREERKRIAEKAERKAREEDAREEAAREEAERKAREEAAREKAAAEQARKQAFMAKKEAEENDASRFAWNDCNLALENWNKAESAFNVGLFEDSKLLHSDAARGYSDAMRITRERRLKESKKEKTQEFLAACRNKRYGEAAKLVSVIDTENADVQFSLGIMYADDSSVVKDEAEAVKWYRRAAEQGHAVAQYNLGTCYENGNSVVKKDEEEALRWYEKASANGSELAKRRLEELRRTRERFKNDASKRIVDLTKQANFDLNNSDTWPVSAYVTPDQRLALLYALRQMQAVEAERTGVTQTPTEKLPGSLQSTLP